MLLHTNIHHAKKFINYLGSNLWCIHIEVRKHFPVIVISRFRLHVLSRRSRGGLHRWQVGLLLHWCDWGDGVAVQLGGHGHGATTIFPSVVVLRNIVEGSLGTMLGRGASASPAHERPVMEVRLGELGALESIRRVSSIVVRRRMEGVLKWWRRNERRRVGDVAPHRPGRERWHHLLHRRRKQRGDEFVVNFSHTSSLDHSVHFHVYRRQRPLTQVLCLESLPQEWFILRQ